MTKQVDYYKQLSAPDDPEIIQNIFGLIDLTSLNVTDTDQTIELLVDKVNSFKTVYPELKQVAGICVYPVFLELLNNRLIDKSIDTVIVAGNFPNAHTGIDIKLSEIEWLVQSNAREIDVVFPIRYLFTNEATKAEIELKQMKAVAGSRKLKVILEASYLSTAHLKQACQICFSAGVDFIKTSTGKESSVATLEAMQTMCIEIENHFSKTGKKVGIKPAGGIRSYQSAYQYYALVQDYLGPEWLNKSLFRIGASSLANDLLKHYNNYYNRQFEKFF